MVKGEINNTHPVVWFQTALGRCTVVGPTFLVEKVVFTDRVPLKYEAHTTHLFVLSVGFFGECCPPDPKLNTEMDYSCVLCHIMCVRLCVAMMLLMIILPVSSVLLSCC